MKLNVQITEISEDGVTDLGEIRIVMDQHAGSLANFDVMYRPRSHGSWSRTARVRDWPRSAWPWPLVRRAIEVLELDDVLPARS